MSKYKAGDVLVYDEEYLALWLVEGLDNGCYLITVMDDEMLPNIGDRRLVYESDHIDNHFQVFKISERNR